jgi:hypothetical protein
MIYKTDHPPCNINATQHVNLTRTSFICFNVEGEMSQDLAFKLTKSDLFFNLMLKETPQVPKFLTSKPRHSTETVNNRHASRNNMAGRDGLYKQDEVLK